MVRRTYYIAESDADALEQAVAEVVRAVGGTVPQYEALGALIRAGLRQQDEVVQALRKQIMERWQA